MNLLFVPDQLLPTQLSGYKTTATWDGESVWVLVSYNGSGPNPTIRGLWQGNGRSFKPIAYGEAILPNDACPLGLHLRAVGKKLHLFAYMVGDGPGTMRHFVFDGERFVALADPAQPNACVPVVDEKRRVLTAFSADGSIREYRDGSWQSVGALDLQFKRVVATWDAAREVIVVLCDDTEARSWDGSALGRLPTLKLDTPVFFGIPHPTSGRAVFFALNTGVVLENHEFKGLEAEGAPTFFWPLEGDVLRRPGAVEIWGVRSRGVPEAQRITWDGKHCTSHGSFPGWGGLVDRSHVFDVQGYDATGFIRRRSTANGDAWESLPASKKKLTGRYLLPVCAFDPATQRLIVCGGIDERSNKASRDTWSWTLKEGWTQPTVKGNPSVRVAGFGRWAGGKLIVTGGSVPSRSDKVAPQRHTDEFDGAAWKAFADVYQGGEPPTFNGLLVDGTRVFAVALAGTQVDLWVYGGSGTWTRSASIAMENHTRLDANCTFDYDPKHRRLVAKGEEVTCFGGAGLLVAEIGQWIDTLSAPGAPAPTADASAPPKTGGRTAYVVKPGKKPAADHFGGDAPIVPPACSSCGEPMAFLATFTADVERLPLGAKKGLALFQCASGKPCKPWEPDAGANAVVLLDEAPAASGAGLGFSAKPDSEPGGSAKRRPVLGSKLGGFPSWIQDEAVPTCAACKGPMTFALQLDDTCGANFGDDGLGYVFTCPHGGKLLSQS